MLEIKNFKSHSLLSYKTVNDVCKMICFQNEDIFILLPYQKGEAIIYYSGKEFQEAYQSSSEAMEKMLKRSYLLLWSEGDSVLTDGNRRIYELYGFCCKRDIIVFYSEDSHLSEIKILNGKNSREFYCSTRLMDRQNRTAKLADALSSCFREQLERDFSKKLLSKDPLARLFLEFFSDGEAVSINLAAASTAEKAQVCEEYGMETAENSGSYSRRYSPSDEISDSLELVYASSYTDGKNSEALLESIVFQVRENFNLNSLPLADDFLFAEPERYD